MGYQAGGPPHTYCFGPNFNPNLEDEADYAMETSLEHDTDMSTTFQTSCISTTDVKWRDDDLDPGVQAQHQCVDLSSNDICLASVITLDPEEINVGDLDPEDRLQTACHEAGHSVGLEHGANKNDCMIVAIDPPDASVQWRRYSGHHIDDHIDPTY